MNELNTVVLSAGSFSAGDSSKASALKPLDIVTTAGAAGDFVGCACKPCQELPANPDDGRLFVRGGTADETQIFVDGNRVFSPYLPTTGNIPTRGRFSPFLFDGITFSTGGYSAEYGDALVLSSITKYHQLSHRRKNRNPTHDRWRWCWKYSNMGR